MTELAPAQQQFITPTPYYENHPWFFDSWRRRHERHKNLLVSATGQSLGIAKTYWLLSAFEKMYPGFTIDQVVYVPKQFWEILESLPRGEWAGILGDDPTKGLQKRDWYKEVNKAVTSFAKTASRYRQRDLGFALPSFDDLDIALREIMVLEAQMKEPGLAKIHRVKRNKFGNPPFWKPYQWEVQLHFLNHALPVVIVKHLLYQADISFIMCLNAELRPVLLDCIVGSFQHIQLVSFSVNLDHARLIAIIVKRDRFDDHFLA